MYQADFNAERQARERIAGEKADLEEELRNSLGTIIYLFIFYLFIYLFIHFYLGGFCHIKKIVCANYFHKYVLVSLEF